MRQLITDISTAFNKRFKTVMPVRNDVPPCIANFNSLCQAPIKPIDLGDGRKILFTDWQPSSAAPTKDGEFNWIDGRIKIKLEGWIVKS
jgi:hypothetical protein